MAKARSTYSAKKGTWDINQTLLYVQALTLVIPPVYVLNTKHHLFG